LESKNKLMRIFIDADACPKPVKEILYRAAIRTKTELILVANQYIQIPASPLIRIIQVSSGFDEADKRIVEELHAGDLVITADIPLASFAVEKGGIALNPRGRLYTRDTIKQQLAMRNLMEQLRENQQISGGPASYNKLDCQALANQLDKLLAKK
jgi:uncharacterized protein YaiI (UPF0178 family)